MRRLAPVALALLTAAGSGCGKRTEPTRAVRASASAKPSARPQASVPAPLPKEAAGCRALVATGSIERGGTPVRPSATFHGKDWVELRKDAKLTLRHSVSAREYSLIGPAHARVCREGEEQISLARGRFSSTSGAGARPGAEVLVFTPFGTVRYGDATLTVTVESDRLRVEVESGEAWLDPAPEGAKPVSIVRGKPAVLRGKPNRALLEQRCERLAQAAADLAQSFGAPLKDRADLAKKAVEHLQARRAARRSCSEGEAYAGSLEGEERGRLLDRFAALDRRWRAAPARPVADNP